MVAVVTGFGSAFPHTSTQEELWDEYFKNHYGDNPIARRMFRSVGVRTRHAVANPIIDDVSAWSTGARMARYVPEATPLARSAVREALAAASLDARDIRMFSVVSCTGYATPGLDSLVAHDVGMAPDVQRLVVGHMGCYAALPALSAVADFVTAHQQPALVLSIELASLHVQPPTNDVEQMVAHALFSDGAAAFVVEPGTTSNKGLQVVDVEIRTDVEQAELMTWKITDLGFRMGLSQKVPDVLSLHVRPVIDSLLNRNGMTIDDVDGWAAHPGGPRILDVVADQLELKPDDLNESTEVLAAHGNFSSGTVMVVLNEVRNHCSTEAGRNIVALAFGPGLTLYATLLRTT